MRRVEDGDDEEFDEDGGKAAKAAGYVLEFDAARKIAQGLGIHLEKSESIVEVKGDKARCSRLRAHTVPLRQGDRGRPPAGGRRRSRSRRRFRGLDEARSPRPAGAS